MFSCADFLGKFSDYRDGLMDPAERAVVESHLAECRACSRYLEVVDAGVEQLRALPEVEASDDFLPRLQHRIYHIDEEKAGWSQRSGSGASTAFVLMVVMLISAAAWLPLARQAPAVVELPPVAVTEPKQRDAVPALFRDGPLLVDEDLTSLASSDRTRTVLLRYSRLGWYASYRPGASSIR
jgi:anti-sigma factor RsiW